MSVLGDPKLQAIIDRLQTQSVAQEPATGAYFAERIKAGDLSWEAFDAPDRLSWPTSWSPWSRSRPSSAT